jgi:hypothetical protein
VGIEPTTFGLKGRCSTTELRPYTKRQEERIRLILSCADRTSNHAAESVARPRCMDNGISRPTTRLTVASVKTSR